MYTFAIRWNLDGDVGKEDTKTQKKLKETNPNLYTDIVKAL
jgi:hypothetical protein